MNSFFSIGFSLLLFSLIVGASDLDPDSIPDFDFDLDISPIPPDSDSKPTKVSDSKRTVNRDDRGSMPKPSPTFPNIFDKNLVRYPVLTDCGSPCRPSCSEPNPVCIRSCEPGLFCPTGYIETGYGFCVQPKDCHFFPSPNLTGKEKQLIN